MHSSSRSVLNPLRELGSVEEIVVLAERGYRPDHRPRVNSHVHLPPNFSAFESVEQAVSLAGEQGVGVLGTTNYYDFNVYGDFITLARQRGIFPLFGLETIVLIDKLAREGVRVNDPGNPGRMYLCGKGITRFVEMTDTARQLIDTLRTNDRDRIDRMILKLAEIFESAGVLTGLSSEAIIDRVAQQCGCPREWVTLQERHVARAFQEVFFEKVSPDQRAEHLGRILGAPGRADPTDGMTIQSEIRSHLMKSGKAAFVEERFLDFDQAYRLILELGGIPCYPTLADGASPICAYEDPVETLIDRLRESNIYCAEFMPIRNERDVLMRYVCAMREAGIIVTGGTEHNTSNLLPIEPTCVDGTAVPEVIKEIFWEGTCVVAAHQFVTIHGQCGFVDERGRPNAAYSSAQARIEEFRRLGAAVIQRYYETDGSTGRRKE